MYTDYLILTVIVALSIGGGVFLPFEAEKYRAHLNEHAPHANH